MANLPNLHDINYLYRECRQWIVDDVSEFIVVSEMYEVRPDKVILLYEYLTGSTWDEPLTDDICIPVSQRLKDCELLEYAQFVKEMSHGTSP
jgi:hypothetical protein